jgi:uncharacterized membrane protein
MGLPVMSGNPALYAGVAAANANGSVMVGYARNSAGYNQAFRWSTGAGFDAFGPRDSFANGVSGDGSLVVGDMVVSNVNVAYQWSVGTRTFQNLALPSGWPACYATNISSNGLVVVGDCNGGGQPQVAVRWVGGTVYQLGYLASNPNTNRALGANTDGSVILGVGNEAWIWDVLNGVRSLTSILAAANGDVSNWSNLSARAMSADGKTVIGSGTLAGTSTAFIARLP